MFTLTFLQVLLTLHNWRAHTLFQVQTLRSASARMLLSSSESQAVATPRRGELSLRLSLRRVVLFSAAQQGSLSLCSNVLSISTAPAARRTSCCLCREASLLHSFRHGTQKLSHIEAHCNELSLRLKGVDTPLRARQTASCTYVSLAKSEAVLFDVRRRARDSE